MALKNGDMEAYQELLGSAKNNRLKELLSKTDDLLEQLGQKVAEQRRRDGGDDDEEAEAEEGRPGGKMMEGQARYNLSVHRLKTEITKQPECMTAGELRDYQVLSRSAAALAAAAGVLRSYGMFATPALSLVERDATKWTRVA